MKHLLTALLISTTLTACEKQQVTLPTQTPETVEQAVKIMLSELSENDKELLRSADKTDLVKFHRTLGAGIRNDFGLLQDNDELREAACAVDISEYYPIKIAQDTGSVHNCHPDQASMAIIVEAWKALQ
ncbi:MAG: DUF6794 domain-containing protein [Thiolinea sp.]